MILAAQIGTLFAYIGGTVFVAAGLYRSVRRRRLDSLLLVCISAISFSWLEAPYDWSMYAQFPPFMPRMPSWWPFNMTWGSLRPLYRRDISRTSCSQLLSVPHWVVLWLRNGDGAGRLRCWGAV